MFLHKIIIQTARAPGADFTRLQPQCKMRQRSPHSGRRRAAELPVARMEQGCPRAALFFLHLFCYSLIFYLCMHYRVSCFTHLKRLQTMEFGMHFSIWSALRNMNVMTGGKLKTKALRAENGITKSHMKRLSTIAVYSVMPPPEIMPPEIGYW